MHNNPPKTILAVDDEPHMRRLLEISLRQAGYQPLSAANAREALSLIQEQVVDLVVSDLHMPGMNGLQLLTELRKQYEHLPFIMVTAQGEIKTAVEAMKLGASDYILRPFELETLELAIQRALTINRIEIENDYLKAHAQTPISGMIGESANMLTLKQMIQQVAPERATVMITGETGTGKELVAQALHAQSPRHTELFVAVNCAAIPSEILESELLGHEKGAFTGAVKERIGKFELAHQGTLFLDEITEMPIQLQAKLLRVLQTGIIEKLGGNRQQQLDVRVVAASNRDPLQAVREGKLREDLYYRLNVIQLEVPPLRARTEDIPRLANHFLRKRGAVLTPEAEQALMQYAWPGNVRELENILERAAILAGKHAIAPHHLPSDLTHLPANISPSTPATAEDLSLPNAIALLERERIAQALQITQGNKAKSAKLLHISERSLWNKLKLYDLN